MKCVRRILFNTLTAISLLLAIAASGLWARKLHYACGVLNYDQETMTPLNYRSPRDELSTGIRPKDWIQTGIVIALIPALYVLGSVCALLGPLAYALFAVSELAVIGPLFLIPALTALKRTPWWFAAFRLVSTVVVTLMFALLPRVWKLGVW